MLIDLIVLILLILWTIYGYYKGVIVGFINIGVVITYILFINIIFSDANLKVLSQTINFDIGNSVFYRYLLIVIVGFILVMIVNIIVRKLINKTGLSVIDHILGCLFHFFTFYIVICFLSSLYLIITPYTFGVIVIQDSFIFSNNFNDFNLINRMWLSGK